MLSGGCSTTCGHGRLAKHGPSQLDVASQLSTDKVEAYSAAATLCKRAIKDADPKNHQQLVERLGL